MADHWVKVRELSTAALRVERFGSFTMYASATPFPTASGAAVGAKEAASAAESRAASRAKTRVKETPTPAAPPSRSRRFVPSRVTEKTHRLLNGSALTLSMHKCVNLSPPGEPRVLEFKKFLSAGEVSKLRAHATNPDTEFTVSCVENDDGTFLDQTRVSSYCTIPAPLQRALRTKVCHLLNVRAEAIETMSIVKYEPGGRFDLHHDAVEMFGYDLMDLPMDGGGRRFSATMRVVSMFIYLNDVETGHTEFPRLGISVKPDSGKAVLWSNVKFKGPLIHGVEPKTVHRGCEVKRGVKLGINVWVLNL